MKTQYVKSRSSVYSQKCMCILKILDALRAKKVICIVISQHYHDMTYTVHRTTTYVRTLLV